MTDATQEIRDLVAEMRTYAATLRGSQAVGALKLIAHIDPDHRERPDAPRATECAHGTRLPADCDGCAAEARAPHPPEMRTFTNPFTLRRSVLCRRCGRNVSWYRHTGEDDPR